MRIRREGVRAPENDQLRFADRLRIGPHPRSIDQIQRLGSSRRADRARELRRADTAEESRRHRFALDQPHRAGVRIGKDRLWTISGIDDRLQALRDQADRFVPRRAAKFSFTLFADANLRIEQAPFVIGALEVFRDFGAQKSLGERMVAIAGDFDRPPVLDRHQHRAGVGTIMRADSADDFGHGGILVHHRAHRDHRDVSVDSVLSVVTTLLNSVVWKNQTPRAAVHPRSPVEVHRIEL